MSKRYPRRFKHESKGAGFAYLEQLGPRELIYAFNRDGSPYCYVDEGKTIHSSFNSGEGDFFTSRGVWIETFDHHEPQEPSNEWKELEQLREELAEWRANAERRGPKINELRLENERLTKENDNQKSGLWMLGESVKRLAGIEKELTKERDELRVKLAEAEAAAAKMRGRLAFLEQQNNEQEAVVGKMRQAILSINNASEKQEPGLKEFVFTANLTALGMKYMHEQSKLLAACEAALVDIAVRDKLSAAIKKSMEK